MERTDDSVAFDPYSYKGSPNVEVRYGYVAMVIGVLLFTVVNYIVKKVNPAKNLKGDIWRYRNTFVSWIHADIIGLGVIYCLLFKQDVFDDLILNCDYFIYTQQAFSLGYFVYDFFDHVVNKKLVTNYEVILHHIAVIWAFSYNMYYRVNVAYTVIALMTEVNSIFLHGRKLMQFDQWPFDHWLYRLVIFLNMVTFLVFRMYAVVIVGSCIYWEWNRITVVYQVCSIISIIVMVVINPILFWRLFKSDVLRGYKKVNQNNNIKASSIGNNKKGDPKTKLNGHDENHRDGKLHKQ